MHFRCVSAGRTTETRRREEAFPMCLRRTDHGNKTAERGISDVFLSDGPRETRRLDNAFPMCFCRTDHGNKAAGRGISDVFLSDGARKQDGWKRHFRCVSVGRSTGTRRLEDAFPMCFCRTDHGNKGTGKCISDVFLSDGARKQGGWKRHFRCVSVGRTTETRRLEDAFPMCFCRTEHGNKTAGRGISEVFLSDGAREQGG